MIDTEGREYVVHNDLHYYSHREATKYLGMTDTGFRRRREKLEVEDGIIIPLVFLPVSDQKKFIDKRVLDALNKPMRVGEESKWKESLRQTIQEVNSEDKGVILLQLKKEFIIQQYYKVIASASSLSKEEHARDLRMFQAIINDKEALQAVFEYKVIKEHALSLDGNRPDEEFLTDHYGEVLGFANILANFPHIFTEEDREYLQSIIKEHKESDGHYDLALQTEELEGCFEVTPSGWSIEDCKQ